MASKTTLIWCNLLDRNTKARGQIVTHSQYGGHWQYKGNRRIRHQISQGLTRQQSPSRVFGSTTIVQPNRAPHIWSRNLWAFHWRPFGGSTQTSSRKMRTKAMIHRVNLVQTQTCTQWQISPVLPETAPRGTPAKSERPSCSIFARFGKQNNWRHHLKPKESSKHLHLY